MTNYISQFVAITRALCIKNSFPFIIIILLSACGDDSMNDGECVDVDGGLKFCLKIVDSTNSIVRSIQTKSSYTVIGTIKTQEDSGQANVVIAFKSSLGTLDPVSGSALTGSNGRASIELNTGSSAEVGVVEASTTIEEKAYAVAYNFAVSGATETTTAVNTTTDTTDNTDNANNTENTDTIDTTDDTSRVGVSTSVTGAIEFISASPETITLRGTGGVGLTEFTTLTFRVIGSDGLPMANRQVDFSLDTDVGGIDIDPISAVTTSTGLVSTTLQSGNVPTSVRVTATAQMIDVDGDTQTIISQSDQLVISTGLPDQNSFSLSLSTFNVEGLKFDGEESTVSVNLADHFNNPVPDGTTVYFTAEGGLIEPSCQTSSGSCSVLWRSQNPRPLDHRVTILATAIGTESFYDTNGDGKYSLVDGEPYVDINSNNVYDEPFIDDNGNTIFDEPFLVTPNGYWNTGEDFTDALNGRYDPGESFTDMGNGVWDEGEAFEDTVIVNGIYDLTEPFTDLGNNVWDPGEPFVDALNGKYDPGEDFVDVANGVYELGDIFIDYNNNGKFDGTSTNSAGEIDFTDSNNGNSLYDGSGKIPDGENFTDVNENTFFDGPGFADLGEPFLDVNENFIRDVDEIYVDTNNNGSWDASGDAKYTGILCIENNNCSESRTLHVRDSIVLIMSSSEALITAKDFFSEKVYSSNDERLIQNLLDNGSRTEREIDVSFGQSKEIIVYISDTAGQILPEGSTVNVSASVGVLGGTTSVLVDNGLGAENIYISPTSSEKIEDGKLFFVFSISDNDAEETSSGTITIEVKSPKGITSTISFKVYT